MAVSDKLVSNKRGQSPWQVPKGSVDVGLKLYNSLTRKKVSCCFRYCILLNVVFFDAVGGALG